jgi:hypothetical protein
VCPGQRFNLLPRRHRPHLHQLVRTSRLSSALPIWSRFVKNLLNKSNDSVEKKKLLHRLCPNRLRPLASLLWTMSKLLPLKIECRFLCKSLLWLCRWQFYPSFLRTVASLLWKLLTPPATETRFELFFVIIINFIDHWQYRVMNKTSVYFCF